MHVFKAPLNLSSLSGKSFQPKGAFPVSGRGEISYKNGDKYVGELSRRIPVGKGLMTYSNGDQYSGRFINGKPHGNGEIHYSDGRHFVGKFSEGVRHGKGTHTSKDGVVLEIRYLDGKPHGEGVVYEIHMPHLSHPLMNPYWVKYESGYVVDYGKMRDFQKYLEAKPYAIDKPPLALSPRAAGSSFAQNYFNVVTNNQ